ncbi:MAG: hypothetical protein A4E42_01923 [Methanoregulaceae archaeon PtaU1.Bin222]|nr:MAG: hypothetical protein A4E42_01923 [Methanoregulaceae archaeon PtaU1.Bin222]
MKGEGKGVFILIDKKPPLVRRDLFEPCRVAIIRQIGKRGLDAPDIRDFKDP